MRRFLLVTCLILLLCGCGTVASHKKDSSRVQRFSYVMAPHLHHVFVIILENREYQPAADPPYLKRLRKKGAIATDYYAITHPSLPNYIALLGGNTFGVATDTFSGVLPQRTLVDQIDAAGLAWKAYMEDMPSACYTGDAAGNYVKRHDPFMYFSGIRDNQTNCARVQPLGALYDDLRHGPVPNLVWITPNLCHDGHDCGSSAVDSFLRQVVPNITSSLAYKDHGVLFITYDEGNTDEGCCGVAHGGQVELLAIGPGIHGGTKLAARADHYSLLRTIEDGLRLPHLRHAACQCTSTLGEAWQQ